MVETNKQVRVDNWGIFFLQRLQLFFSKTDFCDLTLQFEGNVQLKVHRLVMNACTEYFQLLEESNPCNEENVILMPDELQADVIVPIVNFMYTGMLEFHMSIFERLYKAADLMSISVLTKLLDAQKHSNRTVRKTAGSTSWIKKEEKPVIKSTPKSSPRVVSNFRDLPGTLPGRKLPVWKRKNIPQSGNIMGSQMALMEKNWSNHSTVSETVPQLFQDNSPKPTRFEWPDEDLPSMNLMENSFEDISYNSKPMITEEDEKKASTSFDDLKQMASNAKIAKREAEEGEIDMNDMKDYVKQQRIRTESTFDEEVDGELQTYDASNKRKAEAMAKSTTKRIKISEKENKETTISIATKGELDHTKIVSELLKKYPHLIKKNKSIRLKIMQSSSKDSPQKIIQVKAPPKKVQIRKPQTTIIKVKQGPVSNTSEGPWTCQPCIEAGEEPQEFVLYYLYRKHMTDVHNEKFDHRCCKYCGRKCAKNILMLYHLYTKHGMKPPSGISFPTCKQCPYIALSKIQLDRHTDMHQPDDSQCKDCLLAFTSHQTLTMHMQITGHSGKVKNSFDCQYCTKKSTSATTLIGHMKSTHINECSRDGLLMFPEADDIEDEEEEDEEEEERVDTLEEFIVPDVLPESATSAEKVKILSNVKVPVREDGISLHQPTKLEPSSEAEALSNVASGIATSLGLVDIVVLDDNQQYILPQQQDGQPEFILPELGPTDNPFSQVITTQHSNISHQGILQTTTSTDMASTDELVMVLTDHDYQDEQEVGNADNSNIVVLYSHPVDGQQSQFITSQSNIMVNSETGMLEIRNGATIATSTGNQLIVNESSANQIESIEMIQREIDSQGNGNSYEIEHEMKHSVEIRREDVGRGESTGQERHPVQYRGKSVHREHHQAPLIKQEPEHQETSLENQEQPAQEASFEGQEQLVQETSFEAQSEQESSFDEQTEQISTFEEQEEHSDEVDGQHPHPHVNAEDDEDEAMEIDEMGYQEEEEIHENEHQSVSEGNQTLESIPEVDEGPPQLEEEKAVEQDENKQSEECASDDIPPELPAMENPVAENDHGEQESVTETTTEPTENSQPELEQPELQQSVDEYIPEPMEVDGRQRDEPSHIDDSVEQEEPNSVLSAHKTGTELPQLGTDEVDHNMVIQEVSTEGSQDDSSQETEENIEQHEETNQEPTEQPPSQQETYPPSPEPLPDGSVPTHHEEVSLSASESQPEDENSQESQENSLPEPAPIETSKILDDWEDTDSQQSEKQLTVDITPQNDAVERVSKLMDDWEDDEDDDHKKT